MIALTAGDAELFVSTFRGIAARTVVISSADVYRAYGRLRRTEPGAPDQLPLSEASPLRDRLGPEGEAYNKTAVEKIVARVPDLPATIIRYPAVYGPHDHQRRFDAHVRRMADKRLAVILGEREADWRFAHVYAANAAYAVSLAATNPRAAGWTYNVAESHTPTILERVEQIAGVMGWEGDIIVAPDDTAALLSGRSAANVDLDQDFVLDSSRIRSELGYREITDVEDGLRSTTSWLVSNPPAGQLDYEAEDRYLARR